MKLRSEVLSRTRPSNEGLVNKFFGAKVERMDIPDETEKALFFLLKNSDKLSQTFGNPSWNKNHLVIDKNNKLWSHLTLDNKVPTDFEAALERTYNETKHFAVEGAKRLKQYAESIHATRDKIEKAYSEGKIPDPNKAIIDIYGKVKNPAAGLHYPKPLFGGCTVKVAQNGKIERSNTFNNNVLGVILSPEEIAKCVPVALEILKTSSVFVEDWDDLKFFDEPGIDSDAGIWQSDKVDINDEEICSIGVAVDVEGNGLTAELVYLTPIRCVQQAIVDFFRLINDSIKN